MKYVNYLVISLLGLIFKVLGLVMFWIAVLFRKYLRTTVHNYSLANKLSIKRVMERQPRETSLYYILKGYETNEGVINKRYVSKLEYYIALSLWIFLDDDASNDTYCRGHNLTYTRGERYAPQLVLKHLETNTINYSYFELGDRQKSEINVLGALIWNGRNLAQNFGYKFYQTCDESKVFYLRLGRLEFGYLPDGEVNGVKYYKHIMGVNW